LTFEARDLAIKLSAVNAETEAPWVMACPGCDSTGTPPKPAGPVQPCPAPSKPGCPAPSKKAGESGDGDLRLAGLVALRQQLHSVLAQAG
jgi:hypothetical protein